MRTNTVLDDVLASEAFKSAGMKNKRALIGRFIAQLAVEHGAALLHNDADYSRIARVVPTLAID